MFYNYLDLGLKHKTSKFDPKELSLGISSLK